MMSKRIIKQIGLLALISLCGCATLEKLIRKIKPAPEPEQEIVVDKWLGQSWQNATKTLELRNAYIEGGKIVVEFDKYNWPLNSDEGCDAIACFFYRVADGTITGGKFDWIKRGGQSVKLTENIKDGYGGHQMPAKGVECWYMWGSVDGKERSNFAEVTWK